jgi:hypothetical protein
MNRELKEKWVAALRSGDYVQGNGALKYGKEGAMYYCCLGVLAEVADPGSLERRRDGYFWFHNLAGLLALPSGECMYLPLETQNRLSSMNDAWVPFSKIADWIEANVPEEV